ncbi:MAG TPA: FecR family protein [Candidatus Desulfobacillus sp.]|nr:FecR family protein [Candidatus Desulfobacillus sp.]
MPRRTEPHRLLIAALAAAVPLAAHAAGAARVDFAQDGVRALAPDGRSRPLAKGAEVAGGETVDTGNGRAQLRFSDGAQVSLSPQTQFRIDDYRFSGRADGSEKGFFSLLKGAMRTITGLIGRGNRDSYRVSTAVATIGIRGTEYSVTYGNSINVTTGEGSIEVCNGAGCLTLNGGESAYVADANTAPVMTETRAEIPPPPAGEAPLPGFVAGNEVTPEGKPAALAEADGGSSPFGPSFVGSQPGHAMAEADWYKGSGGETPYLPEVASYDQGEGYTTEAVYDARGLTRYSVVNTQEIYTRGSGGASMQSDGTISWGHWADGTYTQPNFEGGGQQTEIIRDLHYVTGVPTPLADIHSLASANMIGTYSLIGQTQPTLSSDGISFVTGGPVTGSLTAHFGSGVVDGTLHVPFPQTSFDASWSAELTGSAFSGTGSATGSSCTSNCFTTVEGFFAGANAARAGLAYQIHVNFGQATVHGAAAFKQDSLAPSQPVD